MIARRKTMLGSMSDFYMHVSSVLEQPGGRRDRARRALLPHFATDADLGSNLFRDVNDGLFLKELTDLAKELHLYVDPNSSKADVKKLFERFVEESSSCYLEKVVETPVDENKFALLLYPHNRFIGDAYVSDRGHLHIGNTIFHNRNDIVGVDGEILLRNVRFITKSGEIFDDDDSKRVKSALRFCVNNLETYYYPQDTELLQMSICENNVASIRNDGRLMLDQTKNTLSIQIRPQWSLLPVCFAATGFGVVYSVERGRLEIFRIDAKDPTTGSHSFVTFDTRRLCVKLSARNCSYVALLDDGSILRGYYGNIEHEKVRVRDVFHGYDRVHCLQEDFATIKFPIMKVLLEGFNQ